MQEKLRRFFLKNYIDTANLMYILRSGRKTVFHLSDGRTAENYMHMKDLVTLLPEDEFLRINKSVIVAKSHIASIRNGVYTMTDGRELEGRIRTPGAHNHIMQELEQSHPSKANELSPQEVALRFSVLDNLPLPCAVVKADIDDIHSGINLSLCYANEAMLLQEGRSREELISHSFFELFPAHLHGKWFAIHSDVALGGTSRVIHEYDESKNMDLTFHCFQPCHGYSASILIKHDTDL